ncbi:hypothetical protein ACWCQK_10910 [Streptomyces sp. NPDC002306]
MPPRWTHGTLTGSPPRWTHGTLTGFPHTITGPAAVAGGQGGRR